jgi:hypothetical protein
MELPENADLLNALKTCGWEWQNLPNIRDTQMTGTKLLG